MNKKMVELKGIFKVVEIKEIGNKKLISLYNSDNDINGKIANTYYSIWCNDKVSDMVDIELKKKIAKGKVLLDIEGWLKVVKKDNFTSLVIYPKSIKQYQKK
jgi:hypothetical protein